MRKEIIGFFKKLFFFIVYFELFIGGAGRLIEFNSFLTLRMALFLIYFPVGVFIFVQKISILQGYLTIILPFAFLLLYSTTVGIINNAEINLVFEDVKPLLSFFLIFYASVTINNVAIVNFLIKITKIVALLLSSFHIICTLLLVLDYIDFQTLYIFINGLNDLEEGTGEFFFKGDLGLFNYKGDLYMCIGLFFWDKVSSKNIGRYIALVIIFISILLTGTRGLLLMVIAVYFIEKIIDGRYGMVFLHICIALVLGGVLYPYYKNILGDKDASDMIRYIQINEVLNRMNILSFLFGHGFGIGIPVRPIHMEIAYLEIIHKEGIIGVCIWIFIIVHVFRLYNRSSFEQKPFILSIIFVLLLSFTNPYIVHPLGLTMLVTSFSCLKVLRNSNKREAIVII